MEKLSVFIITKNEADRIARCIQSVKALADEIIVVDSGSTDGTQDIAASLGAYVIFNKWPGYSLQKKFGEQRCHHKWVLNLDADEFLSEEAVPLIRGALETPHHAAFNLCLQTLYPLEKKIHPLAKTEKLARLYDKTKAGYSDSPVHDRIIIHQGTLGTLKAIIKHEGMRNLTHWVLKNDLYASELAKNAFQKGKKASTLKLLSAYPAGFLKAFLLRRLCVYGINGVIYAHLFAHFRFMKFAKLKELYTKEQ